MRRSTMEECVDSLTFVRGHRGDINESLHVRVSATRSGNDRTPVGVAHQHHRSADSLQESAQSCSVIGKRTQWDLHGNGLQSFALQGWDDLVPAGCIRPGSMHKDYRSDWKVV